MRRAKRNAAKLLSAAMAVGMMAGMAVPASSRGRVHQYLGI